MQFLPRNFEENLKKNYFNFHCNTRKSDFCFMIKKNFLLRGTCPLKVKWYLNELYALKSAFFSYLPEKKVNLHEPIHFKNCNSC